MSRKKPSLPRQIKFAVRFNIANPVNPPVFFYRPAGDPSQRIYQLNFYTCNPVAGGNPAVIPVVSLPNAMKRGLASTTGADFQINALGVVNAPCGNSDTNQTEWYRLATLTIGGLGTFSHRLFLPYPAGPWGNIPANLTVHSGNIGPSVLECVLQVNGVDTYVLNQYTIINQAGPPAQAWLQQPF